jgi:hypothetical protein
VEASLAYDSEYWLSHCEGFRVVAPGGLLGFVEQIILAGPGGEPKTLVVVGGLSGRSRWLVPAGDVALIQPNRERVSLESSPADVSLLDDWLGRPRLFERHTL